MKGDVPRRLVAASGLALVAALAFAADALWRVTHLDDGLAPVEAWMSPGFVVGVYGADPGALAAVTGGGPGATLAEIAEDRGMEPAVLVAAVQALVAR